VRKEYRRSFDFALAKLTQAESSAAALSVLPTTPPDTLPGVVLGTAGYMAPEQVRGLPTDPRADIFAFGVVLYEMLSGQRAFAGEAAMDAMNAVASRSTRRLERLPAREHERRATASGGGLTRDTKPKAHVNSERGAKRSNNAGFGPSVGLGSMP
jgi:serine/threonine protein kinase